MEQKTVLITGATGNLGSRIMAEMLKDESVNLKLLVYGKSQEAVEQEVRKVFDFWECDPASFSHIEVIRGDITDPKLGFTAEKYQQLSQEVTHIIHCAASFKLNLSIEEARQSILEGTKNVAALAQANPEKTAFKRFNHISTVEVAGAQSGIIKEEFFPEGFSRYLNTYEQAKAETEIYLLNEFTEHSFPITVYRPAMLVGDSVTGKILNPQSVYHLITDMYLTPKYPFIPANPGLHIDPIPLNIIAQAMHLMYDAPETLGNVYHLTSGPGKTMTLSEFITELQTIYKQLTGVDIKPPKMVSPRPFKPLLTLAHALARGNAKAELAVQKTFIELSLLNAQFDNTKTKTFLQSKGLTIPALREYLPTLCKYFHQAQPELALLHKKP